MKILQIVCITILLAFSILSIRIIHYGINLPYDENGRYFEDGVVYSSTTYVYFSFLLLLTIIAIMVIIFIPKLIIKIKNWKFK